MVRNHVIWSFSGSPGIRFASAPKRYTTLLILACNLLSISTSSSYTDLPGSRLVGIVPCVSWLLDEDDTHGSIGVESVGAAGEIDLDGGASLSRSQITLLHSRVSYVQLPSVHQNTSLVRLSTTSSPFGSPAGGSFFCMVCTESLRVALCSINLASFLCLIAIDCLMIPPLH